MVRVLERLEAASSPTPTEIIDRYRPVILSVDPASMPGLLDGVRADTGRSTALAASLGVERRGRAPAGRAARQPELEPAVNAPAFSEV